MKTLDNFYEKRNGYWEVRHGAAVWTRGDYGPGDELATLDGYAPHQSEALVLVAGIVLADKAHHDRWRPGDPPLPQPFSDYLQELHRNTVQQTMANARYMDADHDRYRADLNARRHA